MGALYPPLARECALSRARRRARRRSRRRTRRASVSSSRERAGRRRASRRRRRGAAARVSARRRRRLGKSAPREIVSRRSRTHRRRCGGCGQGGEKDARSGVRGVRAGGGEKDDRGAGEGGAGERVRAVRGTGGGAEVELGIYVALAFYLIARPGVVAWAFDQTVSRAIGAIAETSFDAPRFDGGVDWGRGVSARCIDARTSARDVNSWSRFRTRWRVRVSCKTPRRTSIDAPRAPWVASGCAKFLGTYYEVEGAFAVFGVGVRGG